MEQFDQSLDMMRNGCAPKFKVKIEQLDKLRYGSFEDPDPEIKVEFFCYIFFNYLNLCLFIIILVLYKMHCTTSGYGK